MSLKHTDEQNFEKDVQQSQGLVLVDFWAEWCMPCKRLMPILESVSQQNSDITIIKVNVDENPDLSSTFNIRTIPTLILFKDGQQIAVKNGGAPAIELSEWIRSNAK